MGHDSNRYTECFSSNLPNIGRILITLTYIDITDVPVSGIERLRRMADRCYPFVSYRIHLTLKLGGMLSSSNVNTCT
jgi:hypothetical protein